MRGEVARRADVGRVAEEDRPRRRLPRQRLGAAGRTRAAELFSAARIVPRYVDLYRRVISGG